MQQIQQEHEHGRENYLHSTYDTYVFYPNFAETNVLTMVRNCFIEGLNRRLKFPSAVIIMLSDQIIIEDPLYLPSEVDRKIKWILRELDAAVKIRKSSMPTKSYNFGEPRFMWVRAFQNTKANYISDEILLKYNNMLRKICIAKAVYTLPLEVYDEGSVRCYDYDGKAKINQGFNIVWNDIIKGLKRHDKNDKLAEEANIVHETNARMNSQRESHVRRRTSYSHRDQRKEHFSPRESDRRASDYDRDRRQRHSQDRSARSDDYNRSGRNHNQPRR